MPRSIYSSIPVMLVLVTLQTAVLPFFSIAGVSPQLPFLFALAWTLVRREEEGLIWAFAGGLFLDIFSINLIGINALAYLLGLTAVLWLRSALPESRLLLPLLMAVVATATYLMAYTVLMRVWGQSLSPEAIAAMTPLILIHAIFILPVYWFLYGIERRLRPQPVQV